MPVPWEEDTKDSEAKNTDDGRYSLPPEPASYAADHLRNETLLPDISPHSCSYCRSFVLDFSPLNSNPTSLHTDKIPGLTQEHVIDAANNGCRFFGSLTPEAIYQNEKAKKERGSPDVSYSLWIQYKAEEGEGLELKIYPSDGRHGIGTYYDVYKLPGSDSVSLTSACRWAQDELPPNLAPNSDLSFSRLRSWLQDCMDNHPQCREFNEWKPFIPARVLELTGPVETPTVHLRLSNTLTASPTSSATPPYAILSYCWGGDQPSKLLTARLQAYQREIPRPDLPQTVYDAAIAAARLGFRYLWVDALCIIQDDDDDKTCQIGQMHRIFRGAAVTIAAETATSSTDGFLLPRAARQPSRIRVAAGSESSKSEVIMLPKMYYPTRTETLHTRGWTFQETHLSTRIVAYGAREAVFYCLRARLADGGRQQTMKETRSNVARLMDPGSGMMLGSPGARPRHPHAWMEMTHAYGSRHMTVETDRLLGIAALAEEYAGRAGLAAGEYLAGMWRTDLLAQCLWGCDNGLDGDLARPRSYTAPSWSWASLPPIKFPYYTGPDDLEQWKWCALLEARTTLFQPGGTAFGAVSDGRLRIRARRRRALRWYDGSVSSYIGTGLCYRDAEGRWDSDVLIGGRLDEWEDFKTPNARGKKGGVVMWIVEICHRKTGSGEDTRAECHGLILEEVASGGDGGEAFYRRNGGFSESSMDPTIFDHPDAELCEMTII